MFSISHKIPLPHNYHKGNCTKFVLAILVYYMAHQNAFIEPDFLAFHIDIDFRVVMLRLFAYRNFGVVCINATTKGCCENRCTFVFFSQISTV